MGLLQWGDFTGHSGRTLHFKIECDALDDEDWACAAGMISRIVPPFDRVVGIPRGGAKLAFALEQHCTEGSERILIVDDVWTTGESMREHRQLIESEWDDPIHGAVLFARGPTPYWVNSVFRLDGGLQ